MRRYFRKKGDYQVQLFESCKDLPEAWLKLIPQDHFLSKDNLCVSEDAAFPNVRYLYALIHVNNEPVAAGYFQILRLKEEHLNERGVTPSAAVVWKMFTSVAKPSLMIAGHLFRHDIDSFFVKEDVAPFDAFRMYQQMIREALHKSCAQAVLVKDVVPDMVPYFQNYEPKYMLLRNDISMELEISPEWTAVQHYEKALKHKYAQRYRKVRAHWDKLEIKELNVAEVAQEQDTIYALYKQVSTRQSVRLGILSSDFLPLLKHKHPDELKVWMAYEDEKPVAFFSGWVRDEVFDMFYIGLDYERNEALQLYFNILFFSVEQAILLKKQKLILGRTALEAKARLGCKPQYLSTFLYIGNSIVRNAVGRLQQKVDENEGEWENRHPFK